MAVRTEKPVEFDVRGPIAPSDLAGLCDRVCALFGATRAQVYLCDVRSVEPDAMTVDALARLQLAARRYGCRVRLRNASPELIDLVGFMGLTEVLPEDATSRAAAAARRAGRASPSRGRT